MTIKGWSVAGVVAVVAIVAALSTPVASKSVVLPAPDLDDPLSPLPGTATMVVAGGCFWGIEELFQHVRGVTDAVSGYSGGSAQQARYDLVSTGLTGHAESVKVTFDPSKVTYGQLLRIFMSVGHDPTQRGGQGPDHGPQYRSAIFYAGARQQQIATAYLDQLTRARAFKNSITTQVVPLTEFYPAEAYHQDYAANNPMQPYIVINDLPKVRNLQRLFPRLYSDARVS